MANFENKPESVAPCEHSWVLAYAAAYGGRIRETFRCERPGCASEIERERAW